MQNTLSIIHEWLCFIIKSNETVTNHFGLLNNDLTPIQLEEKTMNKRMTLLALITLTGFAEAAQTKEQFVTTQKANYEKNGWKWDQTRVEADFETIDTNNDGSLSYPEKKAWWAERDAEKAKGAVKKVEPTKAKKAVSGQNKAQFIEAEKVRAANKGWKFKPANVEADFAKIDTNKDGMVTRAEKDAWWKKLAAEKKNK